MLLLLFALEPAPVESPWAFQPKAEGVGNLWTRRAARRAVSCGKDGGSCGQGIQERFWLLDPRCALGRSPREDPGFP